MDSSQIYATDVHKDINLHTSIKIVQIILANRKVSGAPCPLDSYCPECSDELLEKIYPIVNSMKQIEFVIPAFPFSAPNQRKTFGKFIPDRAELLSMEHLQRFCLQIQSIYPPGAKIIIATDGDVFHRVMSYWFDVPDGVPDKYIMLLKKMISSIGAQNVISIWGLRDAYHYEDVNECRARMIEDFPTSYDEMSAKIKQPDSAELLAYLGQKRYITNDGFDSSAASKLSHKKIKSISGDLACQAIYLAEAWGHRISLEFPEAIRLSAHPYPAHFKGKMGICLTDTREEWITPWHGVAVYYTSVEKWEIMKNYKAKELSKELVYNADGQPDYYISDAVPSSINKH